jgi:[ribosomal protein S5]-alanine N-acetyltransferase
MKLRTKRLMLRNVKPGDLEDIVENVNNLNVSQYLAVVPYPYGRKDALQWIKSKHKKKEDYTFIIEKDGKAIGAIGLHKIDMNAKKAEIGYWLGEKYWGQRIMSEAIMAMIDYGFNKLKLERLEAGVFAPNKPSALLLEKFGFRREGVKRKSGYSTALNKVFDEHMYGLLKKEYIPRKIKI